MTSNNINSKKSFNDATFICKHCKKGYKNITTRDLLMAHEANCIIRRTCQWCTIVFTNRGNLTTHMNYVHGNKSSKNVEEATFTCDVCDKVYLSLTHLKYHRRRDHYNLKTKVAIRETKNINQVWYERVHNSNFIVQLRKTKHNTFLIKKYEDTNDKELEETYRNIDLTSLYPTQKDHVHCNICKKDMTKKSYVKHCNEKHGVKKKHHCNNCKKSFSRLYFFIKHVCFKTTRKRRNIVLNRIESLNAIPV